MTATISEVINPISAARLIGHAMRVGVLPRIDEGEQVALVQSWLQVLPPDLTLNFALAVVDTWEERRPITPIAIRNRWEDHTKAQRAAQPSTPLSEQACAWSRLCRCTHTECIHGQLEGELTPTTITVQGDRGTTRERATLAVVWCPICWDARNTMRIDKGKDPRAVGDTTP